MEVPNTLVVEVLEVQRRRALVEDLQAVDNLKDFSLPPNSAQTLKAPLTSLALRILKSCDTDAPSEIHQGWQRPCCVRIAKHRAVHPSQRCMQRHPQLRAHQLGLLYEYFGDFEQNLSIIYSRSLVDNAQVHPAKFAHAGAYLAEFESWGRGSQGGI